MWCFRRKNISNDKSNKNLNPKPADHFSQDKVLIDQPDIIVTKSEKGWRIDLNNSIFQQLI